MQFDQMADFLEYYIEHILLQYECWLLTGGFDRAEQIPAIRDFVDWLVVEAKKDLAVPRGPKKISYLEGRAMREKDYSFTLKLAEGWNLDELEKVACSKFNDSLLVSRCGICYIDVCREAVSFDNAVQSALRDADDLELNVTSVMMTPQEYRNNYALDKTKR